MKKKLLSLIFLCALVLSAMTVSAADNVDGATARKDLLAKDAYILDVRSDKVHAEKGNLDHLAGTYHLPVFDAGNSTTSADAVALQADFTAFVKANKTELAKKPIYILCNSGRSGAVKASELLAAEGLNNYHTITNGAKALEIRYEFLKTDGNLADAPTTKAAIGKENIAILDVRHIDKYNAGHLAASMHIPVFTTPTTPVDTAEDSLATAFVAAVKDNAELKAADEILVLCNSGARGARAATVLLKDAGIPVEKIRTITGGASAEKNPDLQSVLFPTVTEYKFAELPTTADVKAAMNDKDIVIIDVRSEENFNKGSITEYNWPLFAAGNKLTSGSDKLAKDFLKKVEENKTLLANKKIYILCNSGSRGAQNATQLLAYAGYDVTTTDAGVVYTIKYGATGMAVLYTIKNPTNPKVAPKDVVAVLDKTDDYLIIDVRTAANYGAGHLKNSLSLPVFGDSVILHTKDPLGVAFTDYMDKNPEKFAGKQIYVLCNSGSKGAVAATSLLASKGIPVANIWTIEGGAMGKDTDDKSVVNALTYVSGNQALSVLGKKGYVVIDVRSALKNSKGHLEGSLSLPLFDKDNKLDAKLAEQFSAYILAHKADFEGKTVYVLCNRGRSGAAKAIELFQKSEINAKVFTIEGGETAFAANDFVTTKPSSPQTGDPANDVATVSPMMVVAFVMVAAVIAFARKREYTK